MIRIRVVVADDTTLVRRLLVAQLSNEEQIEVAGEAQDGKQAVEVVLQVQPDIVLMDLSMPHVNGAMATQQILASLPRTRVILLTAHDDLAPLGIAAGAALCLNKNCTPREIVTAICRVHSESRWNGQKDKRRTKDEAATRQRPDILRQLSERAGLTPREYSVVEKMTATDLTAKQIATALSAQNGSEFTESAVKHALERAVVKLGVEPRTRAALVKHVLEASRGS